MTIRVRIWVFCVNPDIASFLRLKRSSRFCRANLKKPMNKPRILIACIGNIFHGDDAFGVEVARALTERKLRDEVKLVDYGIRGLDLAYALMDGYEVTIFVDAAQKDEQPGTLYVIEPDLKE